MGTRAESVSTAFLSSLKGPQAYTSVHTANANMADHSVGAWDELHESEVR